MRMEATILDGMIEPGEALDAALVVRRGGEIVHTVPLTTTAPEEPGTYELCFSTMYGQHEFTGEVAFEVVAPAAPDMPPAVMPTVDTVNVTVRAVDDQDAG